MWDVGGGLIRSASAQGRMAGSFDCGNEPSVSITFGKLFWLAEDLSFSSERCCSMELCGIRGNE